MHEKLRSYFDNYALLTDQEWEAFQNCIHVMDLKKDSLLFEAGTPFTKVCIVVKGIVYSYFSNSDGEERVKKICWPGRVVAPYSSLLRKGQNCYFSSKAIEDSILYSIEYNDLIELGNQYQVWKSIRHSLLEDSYLEKERREFEMLCLPLAERYKAFIKTQPSHYNIPQYLIASYLGVNPASLSRVKSLL